MPPQNLTDDYPDIERDGPLFYDKIKCIKLKMKYYPDEDYSQIAIETMEHLISINLLKAKTLRE